MKEAIISAEAVTIFGSFVMLYGNYFETNQRDRKHMVFGILLLADIIASFADMFSWALDGKAQHASLNFFLSGASIYLSFAIGACFCWYIYEYIKEKRHISLKMFVVLGILSIVLVVLFAILCAFGLVFTIDNNGFYHEGPIYNAYVVLNTIVLIFAAGVVLSSAKYLGVHDTVAVMSYITLPLAASFVNILVPDFAMIYPAIALALFINYVMLQGESEGKLIERDIVRSHQMQHDELTGLRNRRAYTETIEDIAIRNGNVGVLFCDVNALKYTNDNYGHNAGDKLLIDFATVLSRYFRKDEIFRISGDEFVIMMTEISESLMERRTECVRSTYNVYGIPPAAIGYAYGPASFVCELIKAAEADMYNKKEEFYTEYPEYKR